MARRRRITTEAVRPEFPVVALYVVSVLLLAFFVGQFPNKPPEGQIPVRLPREGHDEAELDRRDNRLVLVVTIEPGPGGTIGAMTIRDGDRPAESDAIGASFARYRAALAERRAAHGARPSRLVLEIGAGLTHEYYVRLLDLAIEVGFGDVTAYPADPAKR